MADHTKRKLQLATIVYWILLVYIIVALLWWALSLWHQNETIYELEKKMIVDLKSTNPRAYELERFKIEDERKRNIGKYLGEGGTFLLLILVGAVYIYRSVRRQFKLQRQQQNFLMAVTHELKTPIAVARLNLETLQKYSLDEEKERKILQVTLQETLRLDTLINNILIASQLDGHSYKISKEEIDFSSLVAEAVRQFAARYPDRHVDTFLQEGVETKGDPLLLKLLVSNLLENANKYSARDTPVHVRLSLHNNSPVLEITDEGEGIPDEEKKKVFEKFYRIGNEQTRRTQGTGLGLYLCKKIVADHRGTIDLKDNQPRGSTFIVEFPA
jgi:signal transduction histidine kinase